MRDIKFRAWDAIEKKMWEPIIRPDGVLMNENGLGGYVSYFDQSPSDQLMQYTGLKDKNGVEIYEGDIVADDQGETGTIEWSDDEIGFLWIHPHEAQTPFTGEVIGNIYENPEILEGS